MNNDFGKISKEDIDAARRGDTDAAMSKLSDSDRQKINEVLADKEKLKQILDSDAAQKLMKIFGGKQNG